MVGAIWSHSCFGNCWALLSFQKPCFTQTHLNRDTWIPSPYGKRPGYSSSIRCCSMEGRKKASTRSICHPTYRLAFSKGAMIKKKKRKRNECLLQRSHNFITKRHHCFFHYYFLSTMTINTLQRITHQWKAMRRILH